MKKILLWIAALMIIASISGLVYRSIQIKNTDAPEQFIYFDDTEIIYTEATVTFDFIESFIQKDIHYVIDTVLTEIDVSTVLHKLDIPDNANLSIASSSSQSDAATIVNNNVYFKDNGIYTFIIEINEKNI